MTDQLNKYAAEVERAIGLNVGGGADGVSPARDAVLGVRDREMEQLRAELDRVQQAACRTAESLRVAEDQRDRIRTQLLKVFTRTEQAEAAIERVRDLHTEWKRNETDPGPGYCAHCEKGNDVVRWPCPTLIALDEPQQPTTTEADGPRCVCGDQIQLREEIDPNSWVHGPDSDTPCWNARPAQQPAT